MVISQLSFVHPVCMHVSTAMGSHTSATAAGNYGVPVVVNGYFYGNASGMAPRARYKYMATR
jgi:hypothetical protein